MNIYVAATILSAFFAYMYKSIDNESMSSNRRMHGAILKKIFVLFSFLPLFLISALRYNVGTDYSLIYTPAFESNFTNLGDDHFEIGFRIIVHIIRIFTSNSQWLFVITSFIFCIYIYSAIYQQSKDRAYSILIMVFSGFYFISMNGIRQCIGIAIFIYSIKYMKSRELKKYMFNILIASSIHMVSLIYIPIYFLYGYEIKIKTQILILLGCILCKSTISNIFVFIINKTRYSWYLTSVYNTSKFQMGNIILNTLILFFLYLFYNKFTEKSEYNMYTNIQLLLVIMLLFSDIIPLIDRLVWCFSFLNIIFLPNMINTIKKIYIRLALKFSIIICYISYTYVVFVINGAHQILPYKTFL